MMGRPPRGKGHGAVNVYRKYEQALHSPTPVTMLHLRVDLLSGGMFLISMRDTVDCLVVADCFVTIRRRELNRVSRCCF